MATPDLKFIYQDILSFGGFLGFVSTFISIYREVRRGPRIKERLKSAEYAVSSIVVKKADERTSREVKLSAKVFLENVGNELTSLIDAHLHIAGINQVLIRKHDVSPKIISRSGDRPSYLLESMKFRQTNEAIVLLPAGVALLEPFEFDASLEEPIPDRIDGHIKFQFVNHRARTLPVSFQKRTR